MDRWMAGEKAGMWESLMAEWMADGMEWMSVQSRHR
jgi:hypothetical protein